MRSCTAALLLLVACDGEPMEGELSEPWVEPSAGEVVFLEQHGPPDFRIASLQLDTGEVDTLFTLPSSAFAYSVAVHPHTGELLLAYTEPPAAGDEAFDRSVLAVLGDDGPQKILGEDAAGHWALAPQWSADGESVWYVAVDASGGVENSTFTLRLVDRETGFIEVEVPNATEPAVSPTGEYVAWVAVDPELGTRTVMLATADGEPIRALVRSEDAYDFGLPRFSADGEGLFVAVIEDPDLMRSGPTPITELTAPTVPLGHGVHLTPGDWWGIAVDGTELQRVTTLSTVLYDGAAFGEHWQLVAATREGIELVDIAAGESERLLENRAIRSVAWRPGAEP